MDAAVDSAYIAMQGIFRRGLVTVVGSGASCGFGLPGMSQLATHLSARVGPELQAQGSSSAALWEEVASALAAGTGLETALSDHTLPEDLEAVIATEIASCVLEAERRAIDNILRSSDIPAFGRLFQHILRTSPAADVITTNYDRLLEVQAARASVRIDSMFYGHTIGRFDPELSRQELLQATSVPGRATRPDLRPRSHIRLAKPHGSLDWYSQGGVHYRSDIALEGKRCIVSPGHNKYRLGYETPFDAQRERANNAIDRATALLFVGYGFNDDHLQTHIRQRIAEVPTVVLSRTLSKGALEHLALGTQTIGVQRSSSGAQVLVGNSTLDVSKSIWDLTVFMQEVLQQ